MPAIHVSRHLAGAGLLVAALAGGCATTTAPLVPEAIEKIALAPEAATPEFAPVARYGRYTLEHFRFTYLHSRMTRSSWSTHWA